MPELELVKDPDDKKRYVLDGHGELRFGGVFDRGATAVTSGGTEWELERATMSQKAKALDGAGGEAATYEPNGVFKRGGDLRAGGREFQLRPASNWKTRYAIAEGERELATLETTGWTQHRVAITLEEGAELPSAVLLMACWLVRSFSDDSAAATASIG